MHLRLGKEIHNPPPPTISKHIKEPKKQDS